MKDLTTLAARLIARYREAATATGPKAKAVADARFDGMCIAAHALGIGMTPAHVHLTTRDAYRASEPHRPPFFAGTPSSALARRAYDAGVAADLATALSDL